MFTFGKRLTKVSHDIIAYDILTKSSRYFRSLDKYVDVYSNMNGDTIAPSIRYKCSIQKVRLSRTKMDKGLYVYKHGYKVFASKPALPKNCVIVPVIIPAGAFYSYNLFGQILSTEIIYPNKF